METEDSVYKAEHLYKGSVIHSSIDEKTSSNRKEILLALPVYSESFGLVGKIDMFNVKTGELVERKTTVKLTKYGNAVHRDADIAYF